MVVIVVVVKLGRKSVRSCCSRGPGRSTYTVAGVTVVVMKLEQSARREETSGSRLRVPVTARAQLLALQPPEGLLVDVGVTSVGWSVSVGNIVNITWGIEVVSPVGCSVSVGRIVDVT